MDRNKEELANIVSQTKELVSCAIEGNVLNLPYLDEEAIWIAEDGAVFVDRRNVMAYLSSRVARVGTTYDLDISFIKELSEDALSVTGRIQFADTHHGFEETAICYHASWIVKNDMWMLVHIATSSGKRTFGGANAGEEINFDLGQLYDRLPAGIVGCEDNDSLTVRMMNPIILELLGYHTLEQLKENMGSSLYVLVHPDELEKIRDFIQKIRTEECRDIVSIRLRKPDFTYAWVQVTGSRFQEDMLVLICMDNTAQQEQTERLAGERTAATERESDYRRILENTPGGFHCCNMFEPVYVNYVSDSLCQITGYSSKEILEGMHGIYLELVAPEDRETFVSSVRRMMEYPHVERSTYRLLTKDGRKIPVVDISQSVRADDGRLYAYSTVQEISPFAEYLGGEQDGSGLLSLIHDMPFGFCIYNYRGENLSSAYVNRHFTRIFGYDESEYAELSDNNLFPLMYNEDIPELEALLHNMQKNADSGVGRGRMHGKDGMIWVEYNLFVMNREEDGRITLVAFYRDISGEMEKKTEAQHRVEIRTFGYFSVSVDGQTVHFRSEKARELLAVLVDFRGSFVSQGALISCLWEDEPVNKVTLARLRKTFKNLQDELKGFGIEYIVESESGHRRVVPEKLYCDCYSFLSGKPQYQHLYQGSYLLEYSWAENTIMELDRMKEEQERKNRQEIRLVK